MKKVFTALLCFLVILSLSLIFTSCAPEEKVIEKQAIQISGEEVQQKNPAIYKTREFRGKERQYLSTDLSGIEKPASLEEFTQYFHNPPIRQYMTGTCWCFCTTSFLESELKRLGKGEIKLSEMSRKRGGISKRKVIHW